MRYGCRAALAAIFLAASLWLAHAPVLAQTSVLYFPATGHFLDDSAGFLSFWQAHAGETVLGFPIAEAQIVDGLAVQYFEHGRLEQAVDPANSLTSVRTGRVGAEYTEVLWKKFAPAPQRRSNTNERLFETTGHSLRAPFLAFWEAQGGEDIFGAPISEPLWETTAQGRRQVQYFERFRLERDPSRTGSASEIIVGDLGRPLAEVRGVDMSRVANWGAPTYGPDAPQNANIVSLDVPTPAPTAIPQPTALPAPKATATPKTPTTPKRNTPAAEPRKGKYIIVDLSDQWMYAFEGAEQVFSAPVSTGRDGMNTPTGTYAIYAKLKVQTMDGITDGKAWVVPDVPNVMYFNGDVALHGTYWHNKFGTGARLSHGCVNLPLKSAERLYAWAPVGTTVKVIN